MSNHRIGLAILNRRLPNIIQNIRTALSDRSNNTSWICIVLACISLVGTGLYTYLALTRVEKQFPIMAGVMVGFCIVAVAGVFLARRDQSRLSIWAILIASLIAYLLSSITNEGLGVWYTLAVIFTVLLASILSLASRDSVRAGLIGGTVALLTLLIESNFTQFQISPPFVINIYTISLVTFLGLAYVFFLLVLFPDLSLRGKITIAVFSAASVSIVVLATIYTLAYRNAFLSRGNQTLLLAGRSTANEIDTYLSGLISGLEDIAARSDTIDLYTNILLPNNDLEADDINVLEVISREVEPIELVFIDTQGEVIFCLSEADQSQSVTYLELYKNDRDAIKESLYSGTPFISSVIFPPSSQPKPLDSPYFYVGVRLTSGAGDSLGLLAAAYPLSSIQDLVVASNEMAGDQSFGVLLDGNYLRLAHGASPELNYTFIETPGTEQIRELQEARRVPDNNYETDALEYKYRLNQAGDSPYFETFEDGFVKELHAAAIVPLRMNNWSIVFMQPRSVVLLPIEQQTNATALITALLSGLAILASAVLARLISKPITQLTQAAEQTSSGDWSMRVPSSSRDEIGKLGGVFNQMIDHIQSTLQNLEEMVEERTRELTKSTEQLVYRAQRLEAVAEVTHTFAEITEPDQLISVVVNTISERFGFYHVGIFRVDNEEEYAVLVAANSEGGKKMLARGHRLRIGEEGLVGYVTRHGIARIALDVGADVVFFDNPDLPDTRSEITLPLKVGEKIFGALDVQSTAPKAFDSSDIALLSTLADQVAIAIENTRLIHEAQRTVQELELAQRLYVQQEWRKVVEEEPAEGYQYILGKLFPLTSTDLDDTDALPKEPVVLVEPSDQGGEGKKAGLFVPIQLRGEIIGVIELDDITATRRWDTDEMNFVAAVADQIGLALENARLLETTRRRAERERLVSDITTKLRSTNNPQEILDTAVEQLRHALRVRSVKVRVASEPSNDDDGKNE